MLPSQYREPIKTLHKNLGVILRLFNCGDKIDSDSLNILCKQSYEFILTEFPFANITFSLINFWHTQWNLFASIMMATN